MPVRDQGVSGALEGGYVCRSRRLAWIQRVEPLAQKCGSGPHRRLAIADRKPDRAADGLASVRDPPTTANLLLTGASPHAAYTMAMFVKSANSETAIRSLQRRSVAHRLERRKTRAPTSIGGQPASRCAGGVLRYPHRTSLRNAKALEELRWRGLTASASWRVLASSFLERGMKKQRSPSPDIIGKVIDAFWYNGYDALSMTKMAAICGFSRVAIYQYFQSKEDAFRAATYHVNVGALRIGSEAAARARRGGGTVVDILADYMAARHAGMRVDGRPSPHQVELNAVAASKCRDILVEAVAMFRRTTEELLAALAADGGVDVTRGCQRGGHRPDARRRGPRGRFQHPHAAAERDPCPMSADVPGRALRPRRGGSRTRTRLLIDATTSRQ